MSKVSLLPFCILFVAVFLLAIPSSQTQQTPAPSNLAEDGPTLFTSSGCPQCHGPEGLGTEKAPSLRDVRKRKTEEQIRSQIKEGGKSMPPFGEALTDQQISALVEFLRSKDGWKKISASAQKQIDSNQTHPFR
jgi:mono/diheme cytochrome c family protein